jgi:hypothetical protein
MSECLKDGEEGFFLIGRINKGKRTQSGSWSGNVTLCGLTTWGRGLTKEELFPALLVQAQEGSKFKGPMGVLTFGQDRLTDTFYFDWAQKFSQSFIRQSMKICMVVPI